MHIRRQSLIDSTSEPMVKENSQRSLFGEILDWMLMPLLLLWPISIGITYFAAT